MELRRPRLTCVKLPSSHKDGPERSPWGAQGVWGQRASGAGGLACLPTGNNALRQGVWAWLARSLGERTRPPACPPPARGEAEGGRHGCGDPSRTEAGPPLGPVAHSHMLTDTLNTHSNPRTHASHCTHSAAGPAYVDAGPRRLTGGEPVMVLMVWQGAGRR